MRLPEALLHPLSVTLGSSCTCTAVTTTEPGHARPRGHATHVQMLFPQMPWPTHGPSSTHRRTVQVGTSPQHSATVLGSCKVLGHILCVVGMVPCGALRTTSHSVRGVAFSDTAVSFHSQHHVRGSTRLGVGRCQLRCVQLARIPPSSERSTQTQWHSHAQAPHLIR